MRAIRILCLVFLLGVGPAAYADTVAVKPNHPDRYVVVKGDTLWGIAARFLRDPWRWPEVWEINPQIKNPHLIYPGDVITLTYHDGKPVLKVERPGAEEAKPTSPELPTVRMAPRARPVPLAEQAIEPIPLDAIAQFLKRARILSDREAQGAAYIVSTEEDRLIAGSGNRVYVRGMAPSETSRFQILRVGAPYRNPGAKEDDILGYEGVYVGESVLEQLGDPATLRITESSREALHGDLLMPVSSEEINSQFLPRPPESPVEGRIISVVDGVSRIGQYQVVVINKGELDGLQAGNVLAVYQSGETIRDTVRPKRGEKITLPDERAGIIMVFRVFERVSYALVMEAQRDMRLYDTAKNP